MRPTLVLTALMLALAPTGARAVDLVGLSTANELVLFTDADPSTTRVVPVTGVAGRLLAIDVRPADGRLYGVGTDDRLYTVVPATGVATAGPALSTPLEDATRVVADFNPQADRLRLIGPGGQSLRVNVETGQAIVDGRVAWRAGDANAARPPSIHGGAYINSYRGATQTQLFDLDAVSGAYAVQDPPNDGVLRTVGPTGLPAGAPIDGFDIFTDAADDYHGFALSGAVLHRVDVATGTFTPVGPVAYGRVRFVDLAVLSQR